MIKPGHYFITGTDTGIGKTTISCVLLQQATQQGLSTLGLKPVASGCEWHDNQWQNDDALALQHASSIKLPYPQVNPFAFEQPISPHLAASQANTHIAAEHVARCIQAELNQAELTLVEGAGGWLAPINDKETMADIAIALQIPVILVIGMHLGCLNHALLSAQAIEQPGLKLHGWIANCLDPDMLALEDNISTLQARLAAPLLYTQQYMQNRHS